MSANPLKNKLLFFCLIQSPLLVSTWLSQEGLKVPSPPSLLNWPICLVSGKYQGLTTSQHLLMYWGRENQCKALKNQLETQELLQISNQSRLPGAAGSAPRPSSAVTLPCGNPSGTLGKIPAGRAEPMLQRDPEDVSVQETRERCQSWCTDPWFFPAMS